MRNIWKIFTTDIRRISNNVVAVVIIMGLSILPALYAWFNIFSNWDPYEPAATSQLKVAVASGPIPPSGGYSRGLPKKPWKELRTVITMRH